MKLGVMLITQENKCGKKNRKDNHLIEDSIWKGEFKVPSGSGKILTINHLASSNGFLQDCGECFDRKKLHQITIMK